MNRSNKNKVNVTLLGCLYYFEIICVCCAIENNVCPTFNDYYTIKNNSRCWYDISAEFTVPDIIRMNNYPLLEYKILTQDGYILTLFRIPNDLIKNPQTKHYPIYLQHGLVATCANFLGLGKNSLAFVLADAGYDVWLGNYRGNQYSEQHINMSVYDSKYWDHSMDEIVSYDLPAIFKTILDNSNPNAQIIFIGHSLGTTLSLMYAAENPEIAKHILKMNIFMSPAYTLNNMKSPYRSGAPYGHAIIDIVRGLEMFRITSQTAPLRNLARQLCLESPRLMQFCLQLYNLFYGPNTQMGPEIIPVYFNQLPGGTGLKVLNHAADLVMGYFRKYNYFENNINYYGRSTPPVYNIEKVQVPTFLIYSTEDWATTELDALNLYYKLPKVARYGMKRINLDNFNHIDFVFGRHAREIVYEDLIKLLHQVINT